MERMPRAQIFPRQLHPWSVHFSIATNNWIATISRPEKHNATTSQKIRYNQFILPTEREARKFCMSFAPPKMSTASDCQLCHARRVSMSHCRNCGVTLCDRCTCRWERKMLPKTYYTTRGPTHSSNTTRVCKSCDWLSNAFCLALLQGRFQDALQIHATVRL
jgi:hypothetical protein